MTLFVSFVLQASAATLYTTTVCQRTGRTMPWPWPYIVLVALTGQTIKMTHASVSVQTPAAFTFGDPMVVKYGCSGTTSYIRGTVLDAKPQ